MASLTEIYQYPLSGAQGVALPFAELGPGGIVHDRELIVASTVHSKDMPDPLRPSSIVRAWRRVDGKTNSLLPGIEVAYDENDNYVLYDNDNSLVLPHIMERDSAGVSEEILYVNEFGDAVPCWQLGEDIDESLQQMLGDAAVTLVVKTNAWKDGDIVAPAKRRNAPLHIVNAASVNALVNTLLETIDTGAPDLDARRFKPSLVVDGFDPFVETDDWVGKDLLIEGESGTQRIRITRPTQRCKVTGISAQNGQDYRDVPAALRALDNGNGLGTFGVYGYPVGNVQNQSPLANWIEVGNQVSIA